MRRLFTLSILVAILGIATNASERKDTEMLAIARYHLTGAVNGSRSVAAQNVRLLMKDKALSVYGVDGSFIVVSRDDRFPAVIGYSATALDDMSDLPPAFSWWLKEVSQSMARQIDCGNWSIPLQTVDVVPPMLTTQWSQKEPYNLLCPKLATQRCPTGCVATAAAQIMKYFNYPAQGRGYASYTKIGRKVDTEINSVYDWDNMKNFYAETQKTLTDANRAVATLMFDAGASANMEYTLNYGTTSLIKCAKGLGDNFQYDSLALRLLFRDFFTETEWNNIVVDELANEHRPILYSGNPKDGSTGHAFVLDGIDTDGKFHVNWGWAGKCDGYFSLNLLRPGSGAEQEGNFSYGNHMLIGFTPRETPAEGAVEKSFWGADTECKLSIDATDSLVITASNIYNLDYRYFFGKIMVTMDNVNGSEEDSNTILLYDSEMEDEEGNDYGPVPFAYGFSFIENEEDESGNEAIVWLKEEEIKTGTYVLTLVSQALNEPEPTPIHALGGAICQYTLTKGDDGSLTLVEGVPTAIADINATRQKADNNIYNLNGQKVNCPGRGIYIKNGKKVKL